MGIGIEGAGIIPSLVISLLIASVSFTDQRVVRAEFFSKPFDRQMNSHTKSAHVKLMDLLMMDTSIDPSEVMTYAGLYHIADKPSQGL